MKTSDRQAQARAEAIFKRKQEQARDAPKATAEYEARSRGVLEKTARLRALRHFDRREPRAPRRMAKDAPRVVVVG